MHAYAPEVPAWAVTREREEDARKTRAHVEDHPKTTQAVTGVTVFRANHC